MPSQDPLNGSRSFWLHDLRAESSPDREGSHRSGPAQASSPTRHSRKNIFATFLWSSSGLNRRFDQVALEQRAKRITAVANLTRTFLSMLEVLLA
jgi:hypothetical protein